jgi:hypothetical protein
MTTIQRHRWAETAWLAVTIAILTLGLAMVAWEWRNAHSNASLHASDATHHQEVQSDTPEVTPTESPK